MPLDINQVALSASEHNYISTILENGKFPEIEKMWALIDLAWDECRCDSNIIDHRISEFYTHPVWLLNGFFIEQDLESLSYRHNFADFVASLKPKRVADFGGGFGTLARMIGELCPEAEVDVVEPHPNAAAVYLADKLPNVRYVPTLQGEYDVLIATDVFEHVPDPLALVQSTAIHLRMGGIYLIANCFFPVLHCHLPSTFHFRLSWDTIMASMNLQPGQVVSYGRAYTRVGPVSTPRGVEEQSKRWFRFIEMVPSRKVRRLLTKLLIR